MRRAAKSRVLTGLLLVLCLAGAAVSRAEVAIIPPSLDNSMFEENPNASDALGPLFAGQSGVGARRALMAFDVASVVPPGAVVLDVQVILFVDLNGPLASPTDPFALHRVAAEWGEGTSNSPLGQGAPATPGDATWSHRLFGSQLWAVPGGEFDPVASAVAPAPAQIGAPVIWRDSPALLADVQLWSDDPAQNFGWAVLGPEGPAAQRTARRFLSRESLNPPQLFIEFEAPATPPGVPDGRSGFPMLVDKLNSDGSELALFWDSILCPGALDHHLIFAGGQDLPVFIGGFYGVQGAVCDIGPAAPFIWSGVPDPLILDPQGGLLWFLMQANDDGPIEGSWGQDSNGSERNGLGLGGSSGQCGISDKSLENTCGQGCAPLDFFATAPDSVSTYEFGTAAVPPIPADFFGPGSDPFTGAVEFKGAPRLDPLPLVDTIIGRPGPIDLIDEPVGGEAEVPIQIAELSLVGIQPIEVIVAGQPESWVVSMGLSDNQQPGLLTATKTHATGGTAVATLPVKPVFTFARESDLEALEQGHVLPEDVPLRVLDFDLEALPPIEMGWQSPMPWSTVPPRDGGFFCPGETFFLGRDSSPDRGVAATPCSPGALPALVPLTAPTAAHHVCPPPRPPEAICNQSLVGTTGCATCAAPETLRVHMSCTGPECDVCPQSTVKSVPCGDGGDCVAYYGCSACGPY